MVLMVLGFRVRGWSKLGSEASRDKDQPLHMNSPAIADWLQPLASPKRSGGHSRAIRGNAPAYPLLPLPACYNALYCLS
jgi:hypothetical protein